MANSGPAVGAVGVARGDLRPSGKVEVGGASFEARAETGFVASGRPVVVVGRGPFGLTVREAVEGQPLTAPAPTITEPAAKADPTPRVRFGPVVQIALAALVGVAVAAGDRLSLGRDLFGDDGLSLLSGLGLGAAYAVILRGFYRAAGDQLRESWPKNPGPIAIAVVPAVAFAAARWALGPEESAAVPAAIAMLAAPFLMIAAGLLGELLG